MNLHQFRFVQEVARRGLNLTEAAKAMHTSQPGVSKAILEFEEELGVDIFLRHGKRLRRITEAGAQILKSINIIMREVNNLKRIGQEFSRSDAGSLSIATTHTQARYALAAPLAQLRKQFPQVTLRLHQGSPEQVVAMLLNDTADVGLATEALSLCDELVSLPCYEWQHVLLLPAEHPLASVEQITLEQLAIEPIITYHQDYAGRKRIDQAFAQRHLAPNIVIDAIDSDVIKTYAGLGLGLGIVAEMAVRDEAPAPGMVVRPLGHLFGQNLTSIAFKKGAFLRNYVYVFAQSLSGRLSRSLLESAMTGNNASYEL
jgi:LysR family cys regulon transcriptional activator